MQEMRQQLDEVLKQKIATPSMELYTPHSSTPSPSSQLIQAIIDLITSEDYSEQVGSSGSLVHAPIAHLWTDVKFPHSLYTGCKACCWKETIYIKSQIDQPLVHVVC